MIGLLGGAGGNRDDEYQRDEQSARVAHEATAIQVFGKMRLCHICRVKLIVACYMSLRIATTDGGSARQRYGIKLTRLTIHAKTFVDGLENGQTL